MTLVHIVHHHRSVEVEIQERDNDPGRMTAQESADILQKAQQQLSEQEIHESSFYIGSKRWGYSDLDSGLTEARPGKTAFMFNRSSPPPPESAVSAVADGLFREAWIGNIRTQRAPVHPFIASQGQVSVMASATPPVANGSNMMSSWSIDAEIKISGAVTLFGIYDPDAKRATADHRITALSSAPSPDGRSARVRAEVEVSKVCSAAHERKHISLGIKMKNPDGREENVEVPIDHACLIGNFIEQASIEKMSSAPSEAVDRIATRIRGELSESRKKLTLDSALDVLKRILLERGSRYQQDPTVYATNVSGEPYALLPAETLRYGGDCEDWSVLIAAILQALEFDAHPVITGSHAVVDIRQARDGHTTISRVDWANIVETNASPLDFSAINKRILKHL